MSINDNTKAQFYFLNDYRIDQLETKVGNNFVSKAGLDSQIAGLSKYALSSDIPNVSGKLNTADLDTAISGLNKYALSSDIPDVSGKLNTSDLDSSVSGAGYIKSSALDSYYTKTASDLKYALIADVPDVSGKFDKTDIATSSNDSDVKVFSSKYVNTVLADKVDKSNVYSTVQADSSSKLYAVSYINGLLSSTATSGDMTSLQTKVSAIQTALSTLLTSLSAGSGGDLQTSYNTAKTAIDAA